MIDWLKFRIPYEHIPISGEAIHFTNVEGEITRSVSIPRSVTGSHSAVISVRSHGSNGAGLATHLEFSGNPSKFLQGHNVFGSDDIRMLVTGTVAAAFQSFGFDFNAVAGVIRSGQYPVTWVDINYSFALSCQSDVLAWIRAAEFNARTRAGRPVAKGSTVYFQKNSRRWAIKAYSKLAELMTGGKGHKLPPALADSGLLEWCENILRVELRLLGKELKENCGITTAAQLTPAKVRQLFSDYMGRIVMCDNYRIPQREALELPTSVRSTYTLWSEGHDITCLLPKTTFYRHRKVLMEKGVDISVPQTNRGQTNVVPLIRVLEATPAEIPAFAYERGLIAGQLRSVRA